LASLQKNDARIVASERVSKINGIQRAAQSEDERGEHKVRMREESTK